MNWTPTSAGLLSEDKQFLIAPYGYGDQLTHVLYGQHEESNTLAKLIKIGTLNDLKGLAESKRAKWTDKL